nr:uncharacterized protein LOC100177797 [Ciona intestinalis]|eukprot:XP_002121554.2 uncharacterized protein LOC100177797 [Ciona intestinalis]
MKFHILSFLLLILSVRKSASVLNQIRWCDTSIDNTTQVWKSYNDSTSACVKCGSIYRLFEDRSQVDTSCCVGGAFTGTRCSVPCGGVTVACQNQNTFCVNTPQQSCDGYNDCGDGTDEIKLSQITPGCTQCENNQFQCKMVSIFPQCFPRSKVCDGVKNCVAGSDEINCLYHGGRCRGFLCTNIPQCIAENEVCNGHKDCYDGSDEEGCYLGCQGHFHCNNTGKMQQLPLGKCNDNETVVTNKVCDDVIDCGNSADESNCHSWTAWSSWQPCLCPNNNQAGEKVRARKCVTHTNVNTHVNGKCNGLNTDTLNCNCTLETTTTAAQTTDATTTTETTTTAPVGTSPPLSESMIAIISVGILAGIILIVIIILLTYACWNKRVTDKRKRAISQHYNPQSIDPLYPTNNTLMQSTHTLPISTNTLGRSPMSNFSHSPSQKNQNTPLPATPDSIEPPYESISDLRAKQIDPYAQTGVSLFDTSPTRDYTSSMTSPPPLPQRSASLMSLSSLGVNEMGHKPHRERTISRFPAEELGHPPKAPLRKTKSVDTLDKDGYIVPIPSVRRPRTKSKSVDLVLPPLKNDQYATMQASPEHRVSSASANSSPYKNHVRKYSRENALTAHRSTAAPRRRYRNRQHKDGNGSRSLYVARARGSTSSERAYHSDTYASMSGSISYQGDVDSDSGYDVSRMSSSDFIPPGTPYKVSPMRKKGGEQISPPPFDPPKLNRRRISSLDDLTASGLGGKKLIYTTLATATDEEESADEKKEKKEKNKEGYTNVLPKSKKEEPQLTNGSASNKHQATLNGSPFHEYGKLSPVVSPSDKYPDQNETHYDVIFRDSLQSQHNGNDNREGFL